MPVGGMHLLVKSETASISFTLKNTEDSFRVVFYLKEIHKNKIIQKKRKLWSVKPTVCLLKYTLKLQNSC